MVYEQTRTFVVNEIGLHQRIFIIISMIQNFPTSTYCNFLN